MNKIVNMTILHKLHINPDNQIGTVVICHEGANPQVTKYHFFPLDFSAY